VESGTTLRDLAARWYGAGDVNRKPPVYLIEYERLFQGLREMPINLLEIGVQRGTSMRIWQAYFPRATIVGLDAAKKPAEFPAESRLRFVRGDQDDPRRLDEAIAVGGPFDIIIDDASHLGRHTARSFAHLFPRGLKPGGIYAIEDIGTAFLPEFDGAPAAVPEIGVPGGPQIFPSHQHGNVGLVKQLIDHAMAPVMGQESPFAIEKITVLRNLAIIFKRAGQP
jgi:hypothetical protein